MPDAKGTVPVRTQQPVTIQSGQCLDPVADGRGVADGERGGQGGRADGRRGVCIADPLDLTMTGVEGSDHRVCIAHSQCFGQLADLLAVAVSRRERYDRRVRPTLEPADEVRQHGPGIHRGQLVGVAHEDQPGVGPHRLEQARHHRQRDH